MSNHREQAIYDAAAAAGLVAIQGHGDAIWLSDRLGDEAQDRVAALAGYHRRQGPEGDYFVPIELEDEEQE